MMHTLPIRREGLFVTNVLSGLTMMAIPYTVTGVLTVLVSSHNLRELEDVCDHVGIMDHGHVLLERSLAQLQDNMVKLQVVFPDGMEDVPAELPVLHASKLGRVHTLIMRMNAQEATERLMAYSPLLVDAIPLTLEEIFIYELGGADYAVKDIVL